LNSNSPINPGSIEEKNYVEIVKLNVMIEV